MHAYYIKTKIKKYISFFGITKINYYMYSLLGIFDEISCKNTPEYVCAAYYYYACCYNKFILHKQPNVCIFVCWRVFLELRALFLFQTNL